MKIEMVSKMIPFFDFLAIEKIAVDAVKYDFVSMKVDHLNGAVHFNNLVRTSHFLMDFTFILYFMGHYL